MRLRITVVVGVCLMGVVLPSTVWGKPSEHPFEIVPGSFHFGPLITQAGAHADWNVSFDFAHEVSGATYNDVRNIVVNVPAGFDASNTAVPTCTQAQLLATSPASLTGELPDCPIASQVGQLSLEFFSTDTEPIALTVPIYLMEVSSFGTTAELGFRTVVFTGKLQVEVRPQDVGITSASFNIPKIGEGHNIKATIWGLPAAQEHDAMRGAICGVGGERPPICVNEFGSPQEARIPVKPLLSNPTSCGLFHATMEADSWEQPADWSVASADTGPITECDRVQFQPSIEVQPSTRSAEAPTGLDVSLSVPQTWENPFTIATSNLKDAQVTLPEGMTANPSLAAGLGACTPQQYAAETSSSLPGEGCPPESKIGSIEIETPLLAQKVPGAIYIAKPYENPFSEPGHPNGSLLALYVVAKEPERGILIKVAGKVEPNPVTGQLVTTFLDNPQQPFSKFMLRFRPGATAPLVSPPVCGVYSTQAALTPWSAPNEPRFVSSSFAITQGVHEGACPSGGMPPLKPQVIAGTQNNAAGSYSPFYLRIVREDGEQELTKFTTILPPGLTGNLTGIPFCPDAKIEAARQATGQQELSEPSCPAGSEIGHTIVGAGVGTVLAQTPGKVYLAGPYHGSALSIVSITSATVGPFDLGTVVIRFALRINPITAQVEVDATGSDPIPHIIHGIVVHVRDIRVYMSRPNFTLNPTNCQKMSLTNTITGTDLASQTQVAISSPFQAADCASLTFKPSFKVSTSGKTSRRNGASLTVKLTYPKLPLGTQANIRSVKVNLPKQLPSRLTTLQKACPDKIFDANPATCPVASRVGTAKAITPILPVPLEGPAYFVSHGAARFPELIIVLQGYGLTIDLHGETFISKTGITSSTFRSVPDQPVTSFTLTLPQGPNSALAANGNLCAIAKTKATKKANARKRKARKTHPSTLVMPTAFTAQNGMTIHQNTPVSVTGCKKTGRARSS
jgi:hypothetical protein